MIKQFTLPLPHHETMGHDDFMSAPCNQEALRWIETWPQWADPYLIIYGPQGSGKTHLAHLFQQRSRAHLLTSDELLNGDLRNTVSAHPALVIDNIQTYMVSSEAEEKLFHLINMARENKSFLLMTSKDAPSRWKLKLKDLSSRLLACPQVAIALPDDTLISAMIMKQFHDRQMTVSADVLEFILSRLPRTFLAVRTIVQALDQASLAERRGITVAFVKKLLEEDHFLFDEHTIE